MTMYTILQHITKTGKKSRFWIVSDSESSFKMSTKSDALSLMTKLNSLINRNDLDIDEIYEYHPLEFIVEEIPQQLDELNVDNFENKKNEELGEDKKVEETENSTVQTDSVFYSKIDAINDIIKRSEILQEILSKNGGVITPPSSKEYIRQFNCFDHIIMNDYEYRWFLKESDLKYFNFNKNKFNYRQLVIDILDNYDFGNYKEYELKLDYDTKNFTYDRTVYYNKFQKLTWLDPYFPELRIIEKNINYVDTITKENNPELYQRLVWIGKMYICREPEIKLYKYDGSQHFDKYVCSLQDWVNSFNPLFTSELVGIFIMKFKSLWDELYRFYDRDYRKLRFVNNLGQTCTVHSYVTDLFQNLYTSKLNSDFVPTDDDYFQYAKLGLSYFYLNDI